MIYSNNLDLGRFSAGVANGPTLFITVTNSGYIELTLNLLESLQRSSIQRDLIVFSVDIDGYNELLARSLPTNVHLVYFPNAGNSTDLKIFGSSGFDKLTHLKIHITHRLLSRGYNVLFADGDIVFFRDPIVYFESCHQSDVMIQNDSQNVNDTAFATMCTGFFSLKAISARSMLSIHGTFSGPGC